MTWSTKNRDRDIAQAGNTNFDLVIIGGGITGAGVAREAALRGFTFCILDKNDFAFGTSSRSSKLVHGGLRYLANGKFSLVRESTTERNWLRNHFPNLVRPLGFMYCSYEKGKDKPFMVKFAITLYNIFSDWFSDYKNFKKGIFYKPKNVSDLEPKVTIDDPELGKLVMAGFYYDNNVDDSRLTIETIKESLWYSKGSSVALNYSKVEEYLRNDTGKINGVHVRDMHSGNRFEVIGRVIVSCTGIWTDELMKETSAYENKIYPTKGVHVVVPNERIGNRNAFGIRSFDDGRFFFILRRGNVSVIGTTDTDYYKESKNLDEPWCTKEDCDYLFNTVNRLFPEARLTYKDIIGTYAGIRPLIRQAGAKNESEVSREHEILESPDGLVAIAGGKLTTYRAMAEEILFYLEKRNYLPAFRENRFGKKGYSRVPFLNGITREKFDEILIDKTLVNISSPEQRDMFYVQYGKQGIEILENIKLHPESGLPLIDGYTYCRAEIEHILEHENVLHLIDIMCRRTEAQWTVWHHKQEKLAVQVAGIMTGYFSWSYERKHQEIDDYLNYIRRTIWF